jgi:hypothetical protein
MPKEVVLNNINDVTYRVPWIVNWIGPYTMNRIGRDGFDSSFFLQGQMMLL